MKQNSGESKSFHQGFNAAAFFGLCFLAYYEVISSGLFILLLIAMIAFYTIKHD